MIAVIDYGLGNVGSILNMLKHVGEKNTVCAHSQDEIESADKYILPGVGNFDAGMSLLIKSGMREALDEEIKVKRKPILGICLGMQMLGNGSEEGDEKGLGYIDFFCKKIHTRDNKLKVPHMGWDYVDFVQRDNALLQDSDVEKRFYFVHSYYAECSNSDDVWLTCDYGERIVAAVHNDNVYGTQFHPEKSHKFGMEIFQNFVRL